LRLVLGDQLSDSLSALQDLDTAHDLVLMAEVFDETAYAAHHKQKFILVFSAMRQFAERLRRRGANVRYIRLGDPGSGPSLVGEAMRAAADGDFARIVLTEPGEWRLKDAFDAFAALSSTPVEIRADDRFIASHETFRAWAAGRKELRMEFFYRLMRRKTGLLMDGEEPAGGRWNFDVENRAPPPKGVRPPARTGTPPNETTRAVMMEVEAQFANNFGDGASFAYPTNAQEADAALEAFMTAVLADFGTYQDAMLAGEVSMWHARIAASLNIGLLDPLDVCRRAEAAFRSGRAPLNAVEGFVRQIIGWREFIRGVYWLEGRDYKTRNALGAVRALPDFYWTGETDMRCVREAVVATRDHAYAHHIQRLMVTGNLAMLIGVHPDEINAWYLSVYADAFEWVELPNTHGMATFADGGVVGSKPYAASGAYINRMSDYCGDCRYDVKDRLGPKACPFNALYWDFLINAEPVVGKNPRMAMPYRNLARMDAADRAAIRAKAETLRAQFGARRRDGS